MLFPLGADEQTPLLFLWYLLGIIVVVAVAYYVIRNAVAAGVRKADQDRENIITRRP